MGYRQKSVLDLKSEDLVSSPGPATCKICDYGLIILQFFRKAHSMINDLSSAEVRNNPHLVLGGFGLGPENGSCFLQWWSSQSSEERQQVTLRLDTWLILRNIGLGSWKEELLETDRRRLTNVHCKLVQGTGFVAKESRFKFQFYSLLSVVLESFG